MRHSSFVGGFQAFGDLRRCLQHVLYRDRTTCNPIGQRFAWHEFQDQKAAFFKIREFVNRRDVRMVQRS
jgi:hypothetical protein